MSKDGITYYRQIIIREDRTTSLYRLLDHDIVLSHSVDDSEDSVQDGILLILRRTQDLNK